VGYLSPVNIHAIPVVGELVGSILQNVSRADQGLGGMGHRVTSLLGSVQFPGGVRAGVGCGVAIGYGWGIGVMLKPSATALTSGLVDRVKSLLPAHIEHDNTRVSEIPATIKETSDFVSKEDFETLTQRVEDLEREMNLIAKHDECKNSR